MASVVSLGIHKPSAIPYLVAESILPTDPPEDQYKWLTDSDGKASEDEVVYTEQCVCWSQGGIIRKVFRFEVEGESVVQAILTSFPTERLPTTIGNGLVQTSEKARATQASPELGFDHQHGSSGKNHESESHDEFGASSPVYGGGGQRALVVILKTQAHVYFLSGTSHVIHLPFEVASVLAAPRGLVLQRKVAPLSPGPVPLTPTLPSAPPNSFLSVQTQPWSAASSQLGIAGLRVPSYLPVPLPDIPDHAFGLPHVDAGRKLPRLFSLTDPLVEMGLIGMANTSRTTPLLGNHASDSTLSNELSIDEEMLYISSSDELSSVRSVKAGDFPLFLALTTNHKTRMYTIWNVRYIEPGSAASAIRKYTPGTSGTRSRRRSSYGPGAGTGATTPMGTGPRESLGGGARGQHGIALSQPNNTAASFFDDDYIDQRDELASRLDPEFESPAAPAKQSRRVSSLLARADLSTSHDRLAFSDLASGHSGVSTTGSTKRGESFGGYSSRGSFGGTLGIQRRGSMPLNSAYFDDGSTTHRETPVDELLEELNASSDFEGFEENGLFEAIGGLQKEIMMRKIESFPIEYSHSQEKFQPQPGEIARPKVFTMMPPQYGSSTDRDDIHTFMYIASKRERKLLTLKLQVRNFSAGSQAHTAARRRSSQTSRTGGWPTVVYLSDIRRDAGITDVIRVIDRQISRVLVLRDVTDGHQELVLEAPWCSSVKIDLPSRLTVLDSYNLGLVFPPSKHREGSIKRVLTRGPQHLFGLEHQTCEGKFDILDDTGKRHRLQVQMSPRNEQVGKVLDVCRSVLPGLSRGGEGVLVGWWLVRRWLQQRAEPLIDEEWTALGIILSCMAVPFIEDKHVRTPVPQGKRRSGLLRSSSGASAELESWNAMLIQEGGIGGLAPEWMGTAGWSWIADEEDTSPNVVPKVMGRSKIIRTAAKSAFSNPTTGRKNAFYVSCASLAREFLRSTLGRSAEGKHGYLPTAAGKDPEVRRTALATILVGLHLLREEQKLDITSAGAKGTGTLVLTPLLAQIGGWLGWESWSWRGSSYYMEEDAEMDGWLFEDSTITGLYVPGQPFDPPSIYEWTQLSLVHADQPFLSIADVVSQAQKRTPTQRSGSNIVSRLTRRTVTLIDLFSHISNVEDLPNDRVEAMFQCGVNRTMLETLPEGILAPWRESIVRCQADPPTTWSGKILDLIGRDDLKMLSSSIENKKEFSRIQTTFTHEASRDVHGICSTAMEIDAIGSFDGSAEIDRQAITRLIFREDRRFNEASKLVHTMRPTVARCLPEPDWSESELLEAQKELVQIVAVRTLAAPSGRGLLYYSARVPLLTEKFPVTGFNLSCVMKPSNNTVTADRSAYTEEKVCWAFFHAGVAAGLSISRDATGIDTSWIVFNKPAELSNRHAGFLLALGLNGHLKSVAKWVAFKYLTPKHTMTSIGLLLGLSASYLGTMDTLVTRLLSVHVTRMLPPGAAELNLSPLTQTTGIMGIGLLYCRSQHRRMSEVMLSEIEHVGYDDSSTPVDALRDEGYRLAAGFALGFINLGKGKDLKGLHDMHLVERLLSIAVGSKKVSIVHILDKATAAATIAIALIFVKSGDETLARKIDIPDTILQFDYVRPDTFLLRTVAKHLIMWDSIQASQTWMRDQLPQAYQTRANLKNVLVLNSQDMAFFNIIAGLCFSIGLRYAGSGSIEVRNLLGHYLDQFIRLCRLQALNYDGKLTRSTVRNCQDLVALSAATVMAGTGDLHIFRRLRSLHGRVDAETSYGSHMATHVAIGVLFLGGGNYTFGTSNLAIASMLCAFYPLFPTSILDNKSHLQAFRHFWVLATEARCLVARDVDTNRPVTIPVSVTLRNGGERSMTAPCLLPELESIATVTTNTPEYWRIRLDFEKNPVHLLSFKRSQTIYIRRRAAHDAHTSVFNATLQALNDTQSSQAGRQIFEWIFRLPVFAGLDRSERALILPPDAGSTTHASLASTVVDDRLVLEQTSVNFRNSDRLWNLRLLFQWAEGAQKDDGRLRWLGKEVIEALRATVWMMSKDDGHDLTAHFDG